MSIQTFLLVVVGIAQTLEVAVAFQNHAATPSSRLLISKYSPLYSQGNNDDGSSITDATDTKEDMNPATKAAWYATEFFGKAFGQQKGESVAMPDGPPTSMQQTMDRLRLDMDKSYFLCGDMDVQIYDEQCEFADPFVSFRGRDRFVDNLQNLGSFITKYDVKLLKYDTEDAAVSTAGTTPTVETKFMVKLELNLPWRPVLAWPWGVMFEIDPDTYKIVRHIESWDIDPVEGVKQIFRKATVKI